jgi:hypothetical protein
MPEMLGYAAPLPWYRRRRWLNFLTLLILVAGYTLALTHYRTLHQHQVRRTEIRKQFTTEVAAARLALDGGQLQPAADAILVAQFSVRAEQDLFWRSEVDRCEHELKPLRARLHLLSEQANAEAERRAVEARLKREKELEEERSRGEIIIRCYFNFDRERINRDSISAALHLRAADQLKKHNNRAALGICQQIIDLEPEHEFDDAFWVNARLKP